MMRLCAITRSIITDEKSQNGDSKRNEMKWNDKIDSF